MPNRFESVLKSNSLHVNKRVRHPSPFKTKDYFKIKSQDTGGENMLDQIIALIKQLLANFVSGGKQDIK